MASPKLLVIMLFSFTALFMTTSHAKSISPGRKLFQYSSLYPPPSPSELSPAYAPTPKLQLDCIPSLEFPPPYNPTPELPPATTPTPEFPPSNSPTPELPPAYSPTPELPPLYNPTPELPPASTPTPEFPPSNSPTPEFPPSYNPTPSELPPLYVFAPTPAPY